MKRSKIKKCSRNVKKRQKHIVILSDLTRKDSAKLWIPDIFLSTTKILVIIFLSTKIDVIIFLSNAYQTIKTAAKHSKPQGQGC